MADRGPDLLNELLDDPDDEESDYGRGYAAGYAHAIADLRAEAKRISGAPSPTMWAVYLAAADFLEAPRG